MPFFRSFILLLLSLSFLSAQGQSFGSSQAEKPATYRSFGNHVGEIGLRLHSNKKFDLYYHDHHSGKTKTLHGKWSKRSKKVRLQFRSKPDMDQLFGANMKMESSSFKIEGDKVIQFSLDDTGLFIWGVFCIKEE